MPAEPHRLVVVGAGFAGMAVVGGLKRLPGLRIHLVDRTNHQVFQPLLYQVATAILPETQIAWPVRKLVQPYPSVTTVMGAAAGVDKAARRVLLADGSALDYDTLAIAAGATHAYFGHDDWEADAPGLKTLDDAARVRRRILDAFERAEAAGDPADAAGFLTFVIVGAGATGVEMAGMIAELARSFLPREYRRIDTLRSRILLLDAGPRILPTFDAAMAAYAHGALGRLGVEIRTSEAVVDCRADCVVTASQRIATKTIIWTAGVRASDAGAWLGAEQDKSGRVVVTDRLTVPGHDEIFVVGDTAAVAWRDKQIVPGVAPAAKQQGAYVAGVIEARLRGRPAKGPFRYRDQGSLATIGTNEAFVDFGRIKLTGRLAWWVWGIAHILFLITPRSRVSVIWSWLWSYLKREPAAQLILDSAEIRRGAADGPG